MKYSSSQIAQSLALTKRAINYRLKNLKVEKNLIGGHEAKGYRLVDLPLDYQKRLEDRAAKQGFENIEEFIAEGQKRWEPELKLSQIHEDCISFARGLQRVFRGLSEQLQNGEISKAEAGRLARKRYHQQFREWKSEKTLIRWLERIIVRDRGYGEFHRIELYLPQRLKRTNTPVTQNQKLSFPNIDAAVASIEVITKPNPTEKAKLWDAILYDFESLKEKDIKDSQLIEKVMDRVQESGVNLGNTKSSIRRNFYRKNSRWQMNGSNYGSVQDQRAAANHARTFKLPEADRIILLKWCEKYDGNISATWRHCIDKNLLSYEITQRFISNATLKSYVPNTIRNLLKSDVDQLAIHKRGPKNAKLKGAYIKRDYSDITPMDYICGDDVTLPVYYYEETAEGCRAIRGQCLLFCDVKTGYILGFALHSERNYNARIIRESIVKIHDEYGLPRKGFYFEHGIWKSKILAGESKTNLVPWEETERGLSGFVQFRYAQAGNPRAKQIEGIIGILQNMMEPMLGYCGRNEMLDKFEYLQRDLKLARRGKKHYSEFLLSKEEYAKELQSLIEDYNESAQQGRLKDRSPKEVFYSEFNQNDPLVKLPEEARYLLTNHRKVVKVTRNGIRLTLKGNTVHYRNEHTGEMIGWNVAVWLNTEEVIPDTITVTDTHNRNPVVVEKEVVLPSMTASNEDFEKAQAQVDAHNEYGKTLYKTITTDRKEVMFRRTNYIDPGTRELGDRMRIGKKRVSNKRQKQRLISRKEQQLGLSGEKTYQDSKDLDRKQRGLKLIEEAIK